MTMWLEATIDYSENTAKILIQGEGSEFLSYRELYSSDLEDLESELEQIAYQIRDFRMKNFPESTEIE
jgi:predicted RNA-binding protein with PIN domain